MQCGGSGMFIPDPDFYPSWILDPGSQISDHGSRIQKHQQKRGVKKISCHTFFCNHKFHKIEHNLIFEIHLVASATLFIYLLFIIKRAYIANSAVFSWWHLSGVLSEPCLTPTPLVPPRSSLLYFKPNQICLAGRSADSAATGYIFASTSYFYFYFNFKIPTHPPTGKYC